MKWNLEWTWRLCHVRWTLLRSNKTIKYWPCLRPSSFFFFFVLAHRIYHIYLKQTVSHPLIFAMKPCCILGMHPPCRWTRFTRLWLISQPLAVPVTTLELPPSPPGMPNPPLKLPWLMSLLAVKIYWLKIFRMASVWTPIQPKNRTILQSSWIWGRTGQMPGGFGVQWYALFVVLLLTSRVPQAPPVGTFPRGQSHREDPFKVSSRHNANGESGAGESPHGH